MCARREGGKERFWRSRIHMSRCMLACVSFVFMRAEIKRKEDRRESERERWVVVQAALIEAQSGVILVKINVE